ncbi:1-deoxy-D-xylulose-5-phosphate reductoisomerase [Papillibacter cinnamivorans]|uniref:1-deoxy-D-xylulose 5-phosphate reductoisomerase n=1 Tax=Papillibacter cinnamivorans DSM 12816 TaxID=1122930 RepID=A0A1W1YMP7_9FIRM|nr:1-deoxy-D-xylulose-5-phosphate reductoisomerase [Papillibacter cinnamivorans]SMC37071.1 1-deoxy-D-xylulose 5-phosphate reductoisomerase [Papillibacter cinnamivorans DSM 12816]
MTKALALLGSTGSIGRQALEIAEYLRLPVLSLSAHRNIGLLEEQARRFHPALVAVSDEAAAGDLKIRLADTGIRVVSGPEGVIEAACVPGADTVLTAVVGFAGLRPTLAAVKEGRRIALANKETLVGAGELVMRAVREASASLLPVDSEHSAIFQCLESCRDRGEVKRILLTASGGPFFGYSRDALSRVTPADALRHPNWHMGPKITVDSATLMNKGLEFIEAMHLFSLPPEKITILVHRESVIHSMVEFVDGAVLAQLGAPDMRLPIQYALTWPHRLPSPANPLDFSACPSLSFGKPDAETFRCLALAMEAAKRGGTAGAVLSGANEEAVELFLAGRIPFLRIEELVETALRSVGHVSAPSLEEILEADREARLCVRKSQ